MKRFAMSLLVVFLTALPLQAQPSAPSRRELAEVVSRESEAYLEAIRSYQWESKITSTVQGADEQLPSISHRCRQKGSANLVVTTSEPSSESNPDRAIGVNTRYGFELRRSPGKGWILVTFQELKPGVSPPNLFRLRETTDPVIRMASPYWLSDMYWLPVLLERDTFKVHQIDRVMGEEGPRVLVRYEYSDEHRPGLVHSGTVTLDPNNSWVITHYDHRSTSKGVTKRTVRTSRFSSPVDGLLLPTESRVVVTSDLPAAAGIRREDVVITTFARGEADQHEFTLSAFGLPEPIGVTWDKPTPLYVWLLVAVGIFGALAVGSRYLSRRRTATSE